MSGTLTSPPVWGRGLKCLYPMLGICATLVAPCMGAWVEIILYMESCPANFVAPCVGAWVEIKLDDLTLFKTVCRPLCGGVG